MNTDTNHTPFRSLDFIPKEYIDELKLLPRFSSPEKLTLSLLAINSSKYEHLPSVKNFMIDFVRLLQTKTGIISLQQLKSIDEQRLCEIYQKVLSCEEIQPSLLAFNSTVDVKKFAIDFLSISNAPRIIFDELDESIIEKFQDEEATGANVGSFLLVLAYFNDTKSKQPLEVVEFIDVFHHAFQFFKKYETKMNQEIYRCWIYHEYLKINDISMVVNLIAKIKKLLTFEPNYQGLVDRIAYDVLETLNDQAVKPFLRRSQRSLLGISDPAPQKFRFSQKIRDFVAIKNLENTDDLFLRLVWFLACMERNYEFSCPFNNIMMENDTSDYKYPRSISSLLDEFSTRLVWNQLQEQHMTSIKDWIFGIYNDPKTQLLIQSSFISQ
jgi:hypothetical protein